MPNSTKPGAFGATNLTQPGSKVPHGTIAPDKTAGKTPFHPDDFRWARYQPNGGQETWQWATVEDLAARRHPPRYMTIQRWARQGATLDEPHLADFFLEGDPKDDDGLEELSRGLQRVYAHFTEDLGIPDEAIGLFYSGGRSFHLTVDWRAIGAQPSPHLTAAYERWAADLAQRFNLDLDLGIYTRARQFRRTGSRHERTGRYKIALTWQDLSRPIAEIQELATTPQPDPIDRSAPIETAPEAAAELARFLAQPRASHRSHAADPQTDDWSIPEGQRNAGLTSIAGKLRRQAFNEAEIGALLLVANLHRCRPPLPDNEVRAIAASVAKYPPNAVPDFSEEAERRERQEAQRLRSVMTARHDFDRWTARASSPHEDTDPIRPENPSRLTPAQKDIACAIARILPTLPRSAHGEIQVGPAFIAPKAGCSRNTAAAFFQALADAGIWTVRCEDYRTEHGEIRKKTYVRLVDGLENSEAAILDAIAAAGIAPKPRGGPRTKTVTLRPALVDDLTCPDCGDAGAVTHATTACSSCGTITYDHAPIEHRPGWLTDEDGTPDPDSGPDVQTQDGKERGSSPGDCAAPDGGNESPMLKIELRCDYTKHISVFHDNNSPMLNFEHRNGSHNHAIRVEWPDLVEAEPRLLDLLRRARNVKPTSPTFCANTTWRYEFKPRLEALVGWNRRDPFLGTTEAYNVAHAQIYGALPGCRGCLCL